MRIVGIDFGQLDFFLWTHSEWSVLRKEIMVFMMGVSFFLLSSGPFIIIIIPLPIRCQEG